MHMGRGRWSGRRVAVCRAFVQPTACVIDPAGDFSSCVCALLPLPCRAPGVMPSVTTPSQVCTDTTELLAWVAFPNTSSEFPPPFI